jgi:DnaJ-class molecular chaperone
MEGTLMICPKCGGNGLRWYGKCRACDGSGGVSSSNSGTDTLFVGSRADRANDCSYFSSSDYSWSDRGGSGEGGGGDGSGGD